MQKLKQDIISLLEQEGKELPTSDILNNVSKEYSKLKQTKNYTKARQVHRKILYHLNALVDESILRIDRYGKNGEKFYTLNVSEGEKLSEISPTKYKKELLGDKIIMPVIPMEGYMDKGIVTNYGNLTERINSIVLMCDTNKEDLLSIIKKLFFIVDDCVCLENFANEVYKKETLGLIKEINKECNLNGREVSISINLTDVDKDSFLNLVSKSISLNKIHFIFGITKNCLVERPELISELLSLYAKEKKSIFLKNRDRFNVPYFLGKAGVYSFEEDEWNAMEDKPIYIPCSQSTVIVDARKFYENYGFNFARFKELLMNISKSFLSTNQIQRKKLRDYFKDNIPNFHRDFLELSRNYIRLWNFGLLEPKLEKRNVLDIIHKSKEKIDDFSVTQDRIFNSCGMPIRFKLALNQASKKSGEKLSPAKFEQMEVENFYSINNGLSESIEEASKISSYFDGGIHIDFHRIGKAKDAQELFNEVSLLLNKHNLAFFSYDFGGLEYGRN